MPRVSVHASDDDRDATAEDSAEAAFEDGEGQDGTESRAGREQRSRRERRRAKDHVDVEIEKEVTKRAMIEAITRLVVVILYMAFTLVREREAGVVALDPEDDDLGPEDDWAEA